MNISGFRRIQSRILLTETGQAPISPARLDTDEQEGVLERLSRSWSFVEGCTTDAYRTVSHTELTDTESWSGLKRWFLSHHLFISELTLVAQCLNESVDRLQSDSRQAKDWASLASRLRKGCGALFLYGIEFEPCSTIYSDAIRSDMPPAFSGYWIRERQHSFQPALNRFRRTFPTDHDDTFLRSIRTNWDSADGRYHELHILSMHLAVPDGNSLAGQYRLEHGKPHRISDAEFCEYDRWFFIERSPRVNRLDYIFQFCDLVERAVADLMIGHRLEAPVLRELLDGFRAAMIVFGNWAGPVAESSRFYPKFLRGE